VRVSCGVSCLREYFQQAFKILLRPFKALLMVSRLQSVGLKSELLHQVHNDAALPRCDAGHLSAL
jgi:hypothetical protein